MNSVDIVMIVVVITCAAIGLWRGLIKSVFAAAGLVGGVALAGRYYDRLAEIISGSGADWTQILSFAIILIAVLATASLIASAVKQALAIGLLDKPLGFVVGLGIGVFLSATVLSVLAKHPIGSIPDHVRQSSIAEHVMVHFPLLPDLLPQEFDSLKAFFQ